MTDRQIENFKISENTGKVVLNYYKTKKDWFDTLVTIFIGLFCAIGTVLLFKHGFAPAPYITILIVTYVGLCDNNANGFRTCKIISTYKRYNSH
jgi:hypothetical protein